MLKKWNINTQYNYFKIDVYLLSLCELWVKGDLEDYFHKPSDIAKHLHTSML